MVLRHLALQRLAISSFRRFAFLLKPRLLDFSKVMRPGARVCTARCRENIPNTILESLGYQQT